MRLTEIQEAAHFRTYHFVRMRSDGVELDSLLIRVDGDLVIRQMEIRNNIEGECILDAEGTILHCTAWESEEAAQASSHWSKHYTQRVGRSSGGRMEVLRIFQNLDRSIFDTYLKHILRIFPFAHEPIIFDADLYHVYQPPPLPVMAEEAVIIGLQKPRIPFRERLRSTLYYPSLMTVSLIITVVSVVSVFFYLLSRPPELPPKSLEMIEIENTDILPALRMAAIGFDTSFNEYIRTTDYSSAAFSESGENIPYTNDQEFLDRLYPMTDMKQVRTFHEQIIKNPLVGDVKKAELLHKFFEENLTKLIFREGLAEILYAYEHVRVQLVYAELIRYCYFLFRHHEYQAVAVESLLLLKRIMEFQSRAIQVLYRNSAVADICAKRNFEYLRNPNEAIVVCVVYGKYLDTISGGADMEKKILKASAQVLEKAARDNWVGYRKTDLEFEKSLLEIALAENLFSLRAPLRVIANLNVSKVAEPAFRKKDLVAVQSALRDYTNDVAEMDGLYHKKSCHDRPSHEPEEPPPGNSGQSKMLVKFRTLEQDALLPLITERIKYLHERRNRLAAKSEENIP